MTGKASGRSAQRRTVAGVGVATAFSLLGDQALYAVLPVYYAQLGLSALQVGLLLSLNRWIRLFTNQLAHRAVASTAIAGHRAWFLAALMLGALTTAAYAFTHSFAVLALARIAWGLAWSFIRHIGVAGIVAQTSPAVAGRTMGIYNGISRVGSVAGLLGGAALVDWLGFVPAMLWLGGLSMLALPFAWWGYTANSALEARSSHDENAVIHPVFLLLGFVLGAVGPGLVMATLGSVLAGHTLALGGFTAATLTGALLALRFALDSAAAPWLGGLTDRLGVTRAATVFFSVGAVALLFASAATELLGVSAAVIAFFVCGTALQAGVAGSASRLGSAPYARYVTAADFGAACGPVVGWLAFDQFGVPVLGLLIGAVLYGLCVVALLLSRGRLDLRAGTH